MVFRPTDRPQIIKNQTHRGLKFDWVLESIWPTFSHLWCPKEPPKGWAGLATPTVLATSAVGTVGTWPGLVWHGLVWAALAVLGRPAPSQAWHSWPKLHLPTEPTVRAVRAVKAVGIAKLVGTVGTVGIANRASRWHSRHSRTNFYAR